MVIKKCRQCGWFWFPGNSLFSFKPAQEAKVNYYRLWNLPPSTKGLMLPVAVLLVLVGGAAVAVRLVRDQQRAIIDAAGVVSEFSVVYLGSGTEVVSFKSVTPLTTVDYRRSIDSEWTPVVVNKAGQIYSFSLVGLEEGTEYELRIFGKIYKFQTAMP